MRPCAAHRLALVLQGSQGTTVLVEFATLEDASNAAAARPRVAGYPAEARLQRKKRGASTTRRCRAAW